MQNKEKNARTKTKVPLDSNGQNLSSSDEKRRKIKLIGQPLEWWQHQYTIVNPIQSYPIQFDFASVKAGDLWRHVKTNFRKSLTCNQCDFASVQANDLRRRVKIILEKFRTSATYVSLELFKKAIWKSYWRNFAHL